MTNTHNTFGRRRAELGNGHASWLEARTPTWAFIKDLGLVWAKLKKEKKKGLKKYAAAMLPLMQQLQEKYPGTPPTYSNAQLCADLRKEYAAQGLDSLDVNRPGEDEHPLALITYHIGVAAMIGGMRGHMPDMSGPNPLDAHFTSGAFAAHLIYTNFNAWMHGSQTFSVSLPLASKLLLTDVSHIKWADFHCPFPSFVIQLPPNLAMMYDVNTGKHPLDTILVVDGRAKHPDGVERRRVEFMFMGRENAQSKSIGDDATAHTSIWCQGPDERIEDAIEERDRKDSALEGIVADVAGKQGIDALNHLARFACSIILYINSYPEDHKKAVDPKFQELQRKLSAAKNKKKRQRLKKELEKILRKPRPYAVGSNITICPELQKVASSIGSGVRSSPSVASYVRGHHKMQPHGPHNSLRKMIWREPYWRGLGVPSQKTYTVKGGEQDANV